MIRLIQPREIDATYELIIEASQWLKAKGIQQWEEPISLIDFRQAIAKKEVFVLIQNNKIAGSVTLSHHKDFYWGEVEDPAIHLHRLVVAREFKGQDLGAKLLSFSAKYAAEQGFKYLRLDCRATKSHLINFCTSNGFDFKGIGQGPVFEYALFEKRC